MSVELIAAVLCKLVKGVLVDLQADERIEGAEAIAWARETLAEIEL